MSYEVLLLMNKTKKALEKSYNSVHLKNKNMLDDIDCESVEKLLVSDPCDVPDLSLFPRLKWMSVSTALSVDQINSMRLDGLEYLSVNVESFSKSLRLQGSNIRSVRLLIMEPKNHLPLIDGEISGGMIDLSDLSGLQELSLHHASGYKINLPHRESFKSIRIDQSPGFDMTPVVNNPQIVELMITGCDVDNTAFLNGFDCLEKLDLSYNLIEDAPEILHISSLKDLCIRRNCLKNPESYRLQQLERAVITEKDYRLDSFSSWIKSEPYNAYRAIEIIRNPEKVSPYIYNRNKDRTDEEIFTDRLVNGIRVWANMYENPEGKSEIPLSKQETENLIRKQYPYLVDRVIELRKKIANRGRS